MVELMKIKYLEFPKCFINEKSNDAVAIILVKTSKFSEFIKSLSDVEKNLIISAKFEAKKNQYVVIHNKEGKVDKVIAGCDDEISIYSLSYLASTTSINSDFYIKNIDDFSDKELNLLYIGWGLSCYDFNIYKSSTPSPKPCIYIDKRADKKYINASVESCCLIRNLVNIPANDFVPDNMAEAAEQVAMKFGASCKITKGKTVEKEFPLLWAVGKGSEHKPCMIDIGWGDENNPLVTIIGKGISFDTGGLNIKPSPFMLNMKKDMGGAAHALGLGWMIMSMKLPVRIRIIIPSAENSISGNSFRPKDILQSRKGITVEVSDTDAEGRLVLADGITLATEVDKPDFMVDFATLTGSARAALGYDIPVAIANSIELGDKIRDISMKCDDAVWNLPLWQGYREEMNSDIADISSIGTGKAGAIHGGLFLQEFLQKTDIDWVHMDIYSWEQNGKAGRPKGGADTGMRAVYEYIKDRFS